MHGLRIGRPQCHIRCGARALPRPLPLQRGRRSFRPSEAAAFRPPRPPRPSAPPTAAGRAPSPRALAPWRTAVARAGGSTATKSARQRRGPRRPSFRGPPPLGGPTRCARQLARRGRSVHGTAGGMDPAMWTHGTTRSPWCAQPDRPCAPLLALCLAHRTGVVLAGVGARHVAHLPGRAAAAPLQAVAPEVSRVLQSEGAPRGRERRDAPSFIWPPFSAGGRILISILSIARAGCCVLRAGCCACVWSAA